MNRFIKSRILCHSRTLSSYLFSVAFLFISFTSLGQNQSFQFEKIENNNGVNLDKIHSIVQDSLGYLWFGGSEGLFRYDGVSFRHYHNEDRNYYIPFRNVGVGLGRQVGELVLVGNHGLGIFDYANNSFDSIQIHRPPGYAKMRIGATAWDRSVDGGLWVQGYYQSAKYTYHCFLFYTSDFRELNLIKNYQLSYLSKIALGENGVLVPMSASIQELDEQGKLIQTYDFEGRTPLRIKLDGDKTLWATSCPKPFTKQYDCNVWFWNSSKDNFEEVLSSNQTMMGNSEYLWVDDQHLWTAYNWLDSLFLYEKESKRLFKFGKNDFEDNSFFPSAVAKDHTGTYWFGGTAVFKMERKPSISNYLHNTNQDEGNIGVNIRGLTMAVNGTIYVGYHSNCGVLNVKTGEMPLLNTTWKNLVEPRSITFFNDKILLDNLLYTPNNQEHTFLKIPGHRFSISSIDNKGELWLCLDNMLEIFRYESLDKEPVAIDAIKNSLPPKTYVEYNSFVHSKDGNVWITTHSHGLFHLEYNGALISHYEFNLQNENSLSSKLNYALVENTDDQIWIGSANGLSRLNPNNHHFTHFNYEQGLNGGRVYSMVLEKEKGLWLGTDKGLSFFNFNTESFLNFTQEDGLINKEYNRFSAIRGQDDRLYFGGVHGIDAFYAKDLLGTGDNLNNDLPFLITQMTWFDGEKEETILKKDGLEQLDKINLAAADKFFSLQFQLADFRTAANTRYSYQLEGYDNWSLLSESNELRYENLPPGEYFLRIKAAIGPELWNKQELKIKVIKQQYWYKTNLAIAVFFILFLGGIYAFYRFQLNQKLEQQESRRLRELDAVKTKLYTNITHEFRTPLTVIIGMIDNIRGFQKERNLIKRNSKNLLRLINQLLDLSKLDSGRMDLDSIQDDVINYLRYLTESFYSLAQERNIQLNFSSKLEELIMDFDEVKLQHIVYNLLSNALKFTPSGGKVSFQAEQTTKNGQAQLKMKITDTGRGIAAEKLPHIFDRFYQADNSTTRKGEGTGIGLALTQELVQLMGGTLQVQSIEGEGSTFSIYLPIQNKAPFGKLPNEVIARKKLEQEIVPSHSAPKNGFQKEKPAASKNIEKPILLVIEDNKDVAFYIRSILEEDYEIHWSKDGEEGVQTAVKIIPDIIISDIMMPKKDGFEVTESLKKDERTSHIPIILLTAKADFDSKIKGLDFGADAYLAKPFQKEELLVRLRKLVELRRQLQKRYSSSLLFESRKPSTNKSAELDHAFITKAIQFIENKLSDAAFGNAQLAQKMTMSESQLHRKLKALTGKSLAIFIRSIRLQKGKQLLETTDLTVSEIAYETGFTDPAYFTRTFSKEFGKAPSVLRS